MAETTRTPVFSRYEVLEKIGSGGMGAVFEARDTHLERRVALKVLPPGLQEHAESLERFKREARALARLKHPSVAAVYDASVERGFPYLVMEFVEGENLERVLRERGPLRIPEVVRLGRELAEALDHIHGHRVVHRDVKTSNIIVESTGRAVLADFGIALVSSLPRISRGTLGTPEYMSPEQADGKPVDGRADLYSLGVVLYECLTGTVPFPREGESLAELTLLMRAILEAPVPPLRERRAEVPAWLAAAVERCLAKRPEDRYGCGADLAAALCAGGDVLRAVVPFGKAAIHSRVEASEANDARHGGALTLISHVKPVVAVAFSPDSRRLASANADGTIRLWEVATGRLLHTLDGHDGNVLSVAFSPDGRCLASGDVAGAVRFWDTRTAGLLHRLSGHTALAMSVAFSPDGARLASGGADGTVRLWEVRRGQLIRTISGHAGFVLSVAFAPDGARLLSGGADGTIRWWDAGTGRLLSKMGTLTAKVTSVSFSPDGSRVASGGADGAVRLWEVGTGRLLSVLRGHRAWVMSVSFSPDGLRLVSAGRDHTVRLWDAKSGRLLRRFDGHAGPVMSAAFSPDGAYLASGSKDHTVRLLRLPEAGARTAKPSAVKRYLSLFFLLMLAAAGLWSETVQQGAWRGALSDEALFGKDGIYAGSAGWTMIVDSRTERSQAEQIATRLRQRGYRSSVLAKKSNGVVHYRVGVGQFPRKAEADAVRKRLAGSDLPDDTWVVRIWSDP